MNKKKTTKQLIIEILAEEFPLGVKQIYLKLKKSKKVTYQAIHKALTELVDSKKVIAKERLYYLNKKWIAEQTDFMSLTYNNYFQKNFISSEFKPNQDIQVIQFSSLKEILKFVQGFYKQYNNSTKQKIIIQARNLYPVTSMLSVLSSSKLKEFCKKNDIYLLIRNNSIADKWTAKFLRTFHINVKTGKSITHYNSIAIGDFVIQWHIFFSTSL